MYFIRLTQLIEAHIEAISIRVRVTACAIFLLTSNAIAQTEMRSSDWNVESPPSTVQAKKISFAVNEGTGLVSMLHPMVNTSFLICSKIYTYFQLQEVRLES